MSTFFFLASTFSVLFNFSLPSSYKNVVFCFLLKALKCYLSRSVSQFSVIPKTTIENSLLKTDIWAKEMVWRVKMLVLQVL